jgi:hypothetical protein
MKSARSIGLSQTRMVRSPVGGESIRISSPFRLTEEFKLKSLNLARCGVAIMTRTVFLESVGRYDRLFKASPLPNLHNSPSVCPW